MQPGGFRLWERWRPRLVWTGVAYLIIAAVGRLIYAVPYLVSEVGPWAALDFKYRYEEVARWFAGLPVYGALDRLLYPPASYTVLWPFMGWLPLGPARVFWAVTMLAAATTIAAVAYRVTETHPRGERLLLALLAFAAYPVQVAVFVGQLPVHIVAFSAAAAYLLVAVRPGWRTDLAGAALLALSLAKPTLAVPLVVATLVAAARWRPVLVSAAIYTVLTLIASAAQPAGMIELARGWIQSAAAPGMTQEGVPNLHLWLSMIGRESWAAPASLIALAGFSAWTWRNRTADPWILLGVAAIVARLWTYHREYDDVVLLLAVVPLLRASRGAGTDADPGTSPSLAAPILFAASWAVLLTPTWLLFERPRIIINLVHAGHLVVWMTVLGFLLLRPTQRHPTAPRATDGRRVEVDEPSR